MMKNQLFSYFFVLSVMAIGVLLLPPRSMGQIGGLQEATSGSSRTTFYDARSVALGDATIADYTNISSFSINPANLGLVRRPISLQHNTAQNVNTEMMIQHLTFPVFATTSHRVAGNMGVHHPGSEHSNYIYQRYTPVPDYTQYQLGLAYAWSYQQILSVGISNHSSLALDHDDNLFITYHPALGVVYAPDSSISYGLVYRGPGRKVDYQTDGGQTSLQESNTHNSVEIGVSLQYPIDDDQPFLSLSMSNEKRFGVDGLRYKGGMEVYVSQHLALRSGIIYESGNGVYIPRFGLGLGRSVFKLDYALSYKDLPNERFHQLSFTVSF